MISSGLALGSREARSEWMRLRTLILLRWLAILGQLLAITLADRWFGLKIALGLCYMAVGVSVIANLVASFAYPANKRLSETEAMLTLLFDIAQLMLLLFLTGGINNPFALLVLVPVTISAAALQPRTTIFLGSVSIALVTVVSIYSVPLRNSLGEALRVPDLFGFGFWLAIVIGTLFLGLYSWRVATEMHSMADALLATQMALAREQKLTDLGGVVAAAAHELGTPLATIKLVSSELYDELANNPDLQDDAALIRDQADKCRDILRTMGRAGNEDMHLRQALVTAVVREAAEPHMGRGKIIQFSALALEDDDPKPPVIRRLPEIIHGLRNLVQNAVDFSRATVWIDIEWSKDRLIVRIVDDGSGFPAQLIGRIGDPFVRSRRSAQNLGQRPEYEGMGLGLFIAKTLLERSGARLSFDNGSDPFLSETERPLRSGAVVEVVWPRARLAAEPPGGLGKNTPIAT